MYIERQQAEMTSGIFNVPLPPNLTGLNLMCWTLMEIFNKWYEENRSYINYVRITISILALGTILIKEILMGLLYFNSIYDGIFFVRLIANLCAIAVIALMVQYLRRLVVPG